MIAALRDTTLSNSILDVVQTVLPYTASGKAMPSELAHDVVIKLSASLKLASLMEQELSIHRFDEAGLSPGAVRSREIAIAVDQAVTGTVVKVDFEKGKKP